MPNGFLMAFLAIALVLVGLTVYLNDYVKRKEEAYLASQPPPPKPPHEVERERQLQELFAALPPTPVERMRATIHVNPITVFILMEKEFYPNQYERITNTYYSVDMLLELSERDRAVLLENQLDGVSLETVPKYTAAQRITAISEYNIELSRHSLATKKGLAMREIMVADQERVENMKHEKQKITIGDYLQRPFSRVFESLPEAHEYSDQLKREILPKVRQLLDRSFERKDAETLEF